MFKAEGKFVNIVQLYLLKHCWSLNKNLPETVVKITVDYKIHYAIDYQ